MNTFPDVDWHVSSDLAPEDNLVWDRQASGRPKARDFGDGIVLIGNAIAIVDSIKLDEVLLFWQQNRGHVFIFPWALDDDLTNVPTEYHGFLTRRPQYPRAQAQTHYRMTCSLVIWEPLP